VTRQEVKREGSNAIHANDLVERKSGQMEQRLGDRRQVSWKAQGRFWNNASGGRVQENRLQNFPEIIERVWFDGLLDASEWQHKVIGKVERISPREASHNEPRDKHHLGSNDRLTTQPLHHRTHHAHSLRRASS
jgi:hypothetical protein